MTNQVQLQFGVQKISIPRIDFSFLKPPADTLFDQSFRVEVLIVNDTALQILFGVSLVSKEKHENTPCANALIESLSDLVISPGLGSVTRLSEIPLLGNMLAVIFPFLREKVASCFGSNGITFFLPPVNTIELLKNHEGNPAFTVTDLRVIGTSSAPTVKSS